MNESGATISEIRAMIAQLELRGPDGSVVPHGRYRDAILLEALNCLANKKEAERRVA